MPTSTNKANIKHRVKPTNSKKPNPKQAPTVRGSNDVRRALTRNKVLEAGIKVLGELGYHAASTSLIAKRAGVSRGALLHQFPTHNDLMFGIVEHIIMKNHERNLRQLAKLSPGIDQYKALTEAFWETSQHPDTIALIEIHMASRANAELAEVLGWKIEALIRSELERTWHIAQEAGINDRRQVDALSTLTIAGIWGLSIMRLKLWRKAEIEDAYELLKTNRDNFITAHTAKS